jgi:photosystem II stability/assembly factor-like uncharacterized protein
MPRLYVGTNGLSVWESSDLGGTLSRMGSGMGLYSGSQVWALAAPPESSDVLYAGTNGGIYRLHVAARRWSHLASPMDNLLVTAIAFSPHDPTIVFAGTQPAGLYRSDDGGASWRRMEAAMKPFATIGFQGGVAEGATVKHWCRVTQIVFDARDAASAWAGVEIDGAWRTKDGGATWQRLNPGFITEDIHGFGAVSRGDRFFATTEAGLHESRDGGASFQFRKIPSEWQYVRSMVERTDRKGVMFLTNGDGAPGANGRLWRSRDYGETWEDARLPGPVESSLYFLAVHPADPKLVFAAATLGQLFRSSDGGETWTALKRRLGEIRCLVWLP